MSGRRNPWLRWLLPLALLGVVVVSNWAWRTKPPSTLLMRTVARTSALLSASPPRELPAWRMVLGLDRDIEPPAWLLHEGAQPGQGYELHWLPQQLALQLVRAGDRQQLLGSCTVDRAPREVAFTRHGLHLTVEVDGRRVLGCVDLAPLPPPLSCGFAAAGDTGGVPVSLHDERRQLAEEDALLLARDPATLATAAPTALALARRAVALDAAAGTAWEAAQHEAGVALSAAGLGDPEARQLAVWLAWNDLRIAAARGDTAILSRRTAELTREAAARTAPPEQPGLLLDGIALLAARVGERPARPVPPEDAFAARARWLEAIADLGYAAIDAQSDGRGPGFVASEQQHWMLRLVVQAAECMAGRAPQPTPAQGPAWLAARWRAFAGRDPGVRTLPDLPSGWRERNPLAPAVQRLTSVAGLEPLAAVALREAVLEALAREDRAAAEAALALAPAEAARQAALTRAILALRDAAAAPAARARELPTVKAALDALGPALAEEDPLGFALDRLLRARTARAGTLLPGAPAVPEALGWAARLLSGARAAPAEAFRTWPDRPLEAVAAALAIQEVAGESPNWQLLELAPCPTLPLRLLVPAPRQPEPDPEPPVPPPPVLP